MSAYLELRTNTFMWQYKDITKILFMALQ
jgi:hypothetical protein